MQEGASGPPAVAQAAAALAAEQAAYDAEAARVFAPPGDAREQFRRVTERGFDAAAAALLREHAALAEAERETMRILNNRCVSGRACLAPAPRVPSEGGLTACARAQRGMQCRGCIACALGHDVDCIPGSALHLVQPRRDRARIA